MVAYGQFTISALNDGTSVESVSVQYYLSTSRTKLTGGSWGATCPSVSDGHYVWTRTGTKLSDSATVNYSQPACITGDKGQTGSSGQGIVSVTPMYIMNESKETVAQPPTGWTEDPTSLEWESGKYIWTTSKIVYKNPSSTVYTTPSCDTAWEAANEVQNNLDIYRQTNDAAVAAQAQTLASHTSSISTISSTVDDHTNQIANKVSQSDFNSSIQGIENDIDKSTGINKWLVEIYSKDSLPEANRTLYDFAAFTGSGINPTLSGTYLDANISKSFLTTKSYIGYALTFVNVTTQFTWTHGFSASGNGRLYVNGSQVSGTTVTMKVGWNVVEVIWNVGTTTPNGFTFTSKLGTNSNVLLMNCYHRTITGREASEVTRTSELLIGLDGITSRVSSAESNINTNAGNINTLNTNVSTVTQTANKINWLVKSGSSQSSVTLTDAAVTAVTNQFVIKDPEGSATIISGGKIQANSITAGMLAANAIKSQNYRTYNSQGQQVTDGVPYNSPYSSMGTLLDLSTGSIYTPNFGVDNGGGKAYINGEIIATSGKIGGESGTYWEIAPVEEDSVEHAAIISNGNAFINTGQWTIKADRINSQSVNANKELVYPSYDNRYYDFGVHIPMLNPAASGYINGVSDDFLYIRYHDNNVPSIESDWNYVFRVDKNGMIYINGLSLDQKYASIDGVSGAYLPRAGGTITENLTVEGDLTVEGSITGNASSATKVNNAIVINGKSFDGSAPVDAGTIGVAYGGTGNTSWTAAGIIYASTANTLGQLSTGTSGQILSSGGNTAPTWINQSAITAGSATKDSAGHTISSYYAPLSGATFTGAVTFNGAVTTSSTFEAADAEIGDLSVTGTATFAGGLEGDLTGDLIGNADTATKLQTARKISLTGDVTGSANFDGSDDVSITATVGNDSHTHTVSTISDLTATATELNYMSGATSSIQTQLNAKATTLKLSGVNYIASSGIITISKANLLAAIGEVTSSANGYMLAADKAKLDQINVNDQGQVVSSSVQAQAPIGQSVTEEGVTIIRHNTSGVTAGAYGPSMSIPYRIPEIEVDSYGHIISATYYDVTAADIVSRLGTTPVNRAIADSDGNEIKSTYLKLSGEDFDATGHTITATEFIGNLTGEASSAVKLKTARTIRTNLGSTSAASFDGTANITPGVTGTLSVANGGTGATSVANIQAGKDGAGNTITSFYVTLATDQTISGAKTFSGATAITNTTVSTSKTTGALKVSGGVGVAGQMSADKVMVGDNVMLEYDSAKSCLNFVFA